MDLLLDTHALLWFLWNDSRLSVAARTLIENPNHVKMLSIASCWEVTIKTSQGKLKIGTTLSDLLNSQLSQNRIQIVPITLPHLITLNGLPSHHRDPFDRLLASQSIADQLTLVSADSAFDAYGVDLFW
jgi:PIN domain nuclease of toxin-antitoxin system